ncbi:predicted protein [Naegleria gruberi]|uniref:Predicted protein n=1 Tax=Naegleria gruberi TaxID=5762 RepID=D2UZV1_NAEGR|nr:uncharacterized protein NAEGRDRAFT_62072 [Naegleria gruberi]EFC49998.1 predicted protein [Naegleria gruberi]|eukprot:XP_002682742.1 predicted protein [Naegleria gruberi strain NEG-M]
MQPKFNSHITLAVILVLVVLLLTINPTRAHISWGKCKDTIKAMENFQLAQFTGNWLEIAKYRNYYERGVCQKIDFTINPNNTTQILVNASEYRKGSSRSMNATASAISSDTPAQWILSVNVTRKCKKKLIHYTIETPLMVLDTDYSNYAILYSCKNTKFELFHKEYLWILGRRIDSISETMMNDLFNKLKDLEISRKYIMFSRQNYCSVRRRGKKDD